jgi:hypothetical protein
MNLAFENIPDPRSFTTDEQFNKTVDCIRSFELKEMNWRSLFSVSQLLRIAFSVFHDIFFILFFFERCVEI